MQEMDVAHLFILSLLVCSCRGARVPAPRKEVRVEGSVGCTVCDLARGSDKMITKTVVLPGAVVKLQCNNTNKGTWEEETTTDSNGNFIFRPNKTKLTTWGAHKCKVFMVNSRRYDCPLPDDYYTDSYFGKAGAVLKPIPTNPTPSYQLFTVRPLYFTSSSYPC